MNFVNGRRLSPEKKEDMNYSRITTALAVLVISTGALAIEPQTPSADLTPPAMRATGQKNMPLPPVAAQTKTPDSGKRCFYMSVELTRKKPSGADWDLTVLRPSDRAPDPTAYIDNIRVPGMCKQAYSCTFKVTINRQKVRIRINDYDGVLKGAGDGAGVGSCRPIDQPVCHLSMGTVITFSAIPCFNSVFAK